MSEEVLNAADEKKPDGNKLIKAAYILQWSLLILWRLYVYLSYNVHYTDDDQALMWYGTVHFAHGHFPEPCFFGQNYGSMLESLLAVPLYYLKCPLNYALPLITLLLSLVPFAFCSGFLWKRGRRLAAMLVLCPVFWLGWQNDVLCTIPRALISGFPFAVIGMVLLCDPRSGRISCLLGAFLNAMAFSMNQTAAAMLGISALSLLLYKEKKKFLPALIGMAAGGGCFALTQLFYKLNPQYCVHRVIPGGVGVSFLFANAGNLPDLLGDYFAFSPAGIIAIPLVLVTAVTLCFVKKNSKEGIITLIAVLGSAMFLLTDKSTDYMPGSLVYGQSRIFLFAPYLAAGVYTINILRRDGEEDKKAPLLILGLLCAAGLILKGVSFEHNRADAGSALYHDTVLNPDGFVVGVTKVEPLMEQIKLADQLMRESGAVALALRNGVYVREGRTFLPHRCFIYAFSAECYDEAYEAFMPVYDRRTWVYEKLSEEKGGMMLLMNYPMQSADDLLIVDLGEDTPVGWFIENLGLHRTYLEYPVDVF